MPVSWADVDIDLIDINFGFQAMLLASLGQLAQ